MLTKVKIRFEMESAISGFPLKFIPCFIRDGNDDLRQYSVAGNGSGLPSVKCHSEKVPHKQDKVKTDTKCCFGKASLWENPRKYRSMNPHPAWEAARFRIRGIHGMTPGQVRSLSGSAPKGSLSAETSLRYNKLNSLLN